MEDLLKIVTEKHKEITKKGKVANYIPGLSKQNQEYLGISVISNYNEAYHFGDVEAKFTIQSVSKPIVLMLAIIEKGEEYVFSKVGMEPTGDAFNSIIRLETSGKNIPHNPMINAGAIAVSSMIPGENKDEKFEKVLNFMKLITENSELSHNEEVYLSEKETGNRNRALAYFMKSENIIESDVEEALDVYFKQCSIEVTTKDLAMVGAFLARGGILTNGKRIISVRTAKLVKSLMLTCGMYDGSGEFALKVGIPSKSGVGGGILCSVPDKFGIGVFGPSLDERGNSIAGIKILEDLSKTLNLSIF